MSFGIVYKFTNKVSGKIYVGVTTKTLNERLLAHLYRGNLEKSAFQKALKKYGVDGFLAEVIDTASSKEELFEKETYWIKTLDCISPKGYNLTVGGGGIVEMLPEIREKISRSKTGKSIHKLKGRERSQQERSKISKSLGGSKILAKHKYSEHFYILETVQDGKNYGFNPSLISAVVLGKRPHHKNFIFTKINEANTEVILEIKESKTP
jgi:group I intron endonuclease